MLTRNWRNPKLLTKRGKSYWRWRLSVTASSTTISILAITQTRTVIEKDHHIKSSRHRMTTRSEIAQYLARLARVSYIIQHRQNVTNMVIKIQSYKRKRSLIMIGEVMAMISTLTWQNKITALLSCNHYQAKEKQVALE